MARTEYAGGAPQTVLTSSMTAGAPTSGQTFTVNSGTGYPTGAVGEFVITVDRDTPSMEKILCSDRSGNTFTIATDGRGYDGTVAVSHGGGITTGYVTHGVDAASLTDDQDHIYDTARDDHTQYPLKSILTAAGDLVYATGASVWARLAKGTARQVLAMNSGATAPEWVASLQSLLTASGDLVYASSANTPARLAKGTDGHVLTLASGLPSWAAAGAASLSTDSATVTTSESTTSTSMTDLATPGPTATVTVGASGKLLVIITAFLYADTASRVPTIGYALSGGTTQAAVNTKALTKKQQGASDDYIQCSWAYMEEGLSSGSTDVTLKYMIDNGAGTASFQNRRVTAIAL